MSNPLDYRANYSLEMLSDLTVTAGEGSRGSQNRILYGVQRKDCVLHFNYATVIKDAAARSEGIVASNGAISDLIVPKKLPMPPPWEGPSSKPKPTTLLAIVPLMISRVPELRMPPEPKPAWKPSVLLKAIVLFTILVIPRLTSPPATCMPRLAEIVLRLMFSTPELRIPPPPSPPLFSTDAVSNIHRARV